MSSVAALYWILFCDSGQFIFSLLVSGEETITGKGLLSKTTSVAETNYGKSTYILLYNTRSTYIFNCEQKLWTSSKLWKSSPSLTHHYHLIPSIIIVACIMVRCWNISTQQTWHLTVFPSRSTNTQWCFLQGHSWWWSCFNFF